MKDAKINKIVPFLREHIDKTLGEQYWPNLHLEITRRVAQRLDRITRKLLSLPLKCIPFWMFFIYSE